MSSEIPATQQERIVAVNELVSEISQQVKTLSAKETRERPTKELKPLTDAIHDSLNRIRVLIKARNKRKSGTKAGEGELLKSIVVHPDLKKFFQTATNLGMTQPFSYEAVHGTTAGGKKSVTFKVTTESGEVLTGPASCGRGVPVKPSKTNVPIGEILKSLKTEGITSSVQLTSLFSLYITANGLKTGGKYRTDAHMDKCLDAALKHIESQTLTKKGVSFKFDRKSFDHCYISKIVSFYTKKDVTGASEAKLQGWAEKCGMTVPQFVKNNGMTPAEIASIIDPATKKVREDVAKRTIAETAIVSLASKMYGHHNTVVPVKKERVVKAKVPAPVLAGDAEPAPKAVKAPRAPAAPKAKAVVQDAPVAEPKPVAKPKAPVAPKVAPVAIPAAVKVAPPKKAAK